MRLKYTIVTALLTFVLTCAVFLSTGISLWLALEVGVVIALGVAGMLCIDGLWAWAMKRPRLFFVLAPSLLVLSVGLLAVLVRLGRVS